MKLPSGEIDYSRIGARYVGGRSCQAPLFAGLCNWPRFTLYGHFTASTRTTDTGLKY